MKRETRNTRLAELMAEKGVQLRDVIPQFGHIGTPYKHLAGSRNMDIRSAQIWARVLGMTVDELLKELKPVTTDQAANG